MLKFGKWCFLRANLDVQTEIIKKNGPASVILFLALPFLSLTRSLSEVLRQSLTILLNNLRPVIP